MDSSVVRKKGGKQSTHASLLGSNCGVESFFDARDTPLAFYNCTNNNNNNNINNINNNNYNTNNSNN